MAHHFFPVRLEEIECVLVSVGLAGLGEQDQGCGV